MDLASGYSDSTNYGNGYTPLANNAINNNNLAYQQNQNYTNMAGMYNPFAQSGGFGAMTDYYSGLGRDYTTATGGNIFGNASGGGGGSNPYSYDDSAGLNSSTAPRGGAGDYFNWEMSQLNNKGIGSDAGQSPSQYQNQYPVVDWNKWATQLTAPNGVSNQQANPWGTSAGYPYFDNPATYGGLPAGGYQPMNNPSAQKLLGYDPGQIPNYGGNDAFNREMYQQVQRDELARQMSGSGEIPSFWQGVRDFTGMGQPGQPQPAWNPWGNTGQQGVTDPMGYGTGGYQGNAIPAQTPVQQQQQPNNLPWFWQSIRDLAGADPKDQSRIPQDTGGYPGMTNPNYQPGGMTPQQSVPYLRDTWTNAS